MDRGKSAQLSKSAARLLVVLLLGKGREHIGDIPRLLAEAGLTPGQYRYAYQQLTELGFITYQDGAICLVRDEHEEKWHA